jgi:hypothetical protein
VPARSESPCCRCRRRHRRRHAKAANTATPTNPRANAVSTPAKAPFLSLVPVHGNAAEKIGGNQGSSGPNVGFLADLDWLPGSFCGLRNCPEACRLWCKACGFARVFCQANGLDQELLCNTTCCQVMGCLPSHLLRCPTRSDANQMKRLAHLPSAAIGRPV